MRRIVNLGVDQAQRDEPPVKPLAEAIATHPGDYSTAFADYEYTHRKYVRPLRRGAGIASRLLVPKTRSGIAMRNAALNALPSRNKR